MTARVPEPDTECLERLLGRTRAIPETGCLEWTGTPSGNGYAYVRLNGESQLVHRAVFKLAIGPIPTGMVIRHACDTPLCVNPDHLSIGTQAENMADMVERGRQRGPRVPLSPAQQAEIVAAVALYRSGKLGYTHAAIVAGWGVSVTTVKRLDREARTPAQPA